MSSPEPKEYEHIEFSFNRPSGFRDGKHYEVTAYLLVPVEVFPELQQWIEAEAKGLRDGHPSGQSMYKTLQDKGALLHREDGPAYKEVKKSMFDKTYAEVTREEYWEKGVQKQNGVPGVKPLGKYKL